MATVLVSVEAAVLVVASDFAVLPVMAVAVRLTVLPVIVAALGIMVVRGIAEDRDIEVVPGIMEIQATAVTITVFRGFSGFQATTILTTVTTRIEDITAGIIAIIVNFGTVRTESFRLHADSMGGKFNVEDRIIPKTFKCHAETGSLRLLSRDPHGADA